MRRSLKLKLRVGKSLYDGVCAKAAEAFAERRYRNAVAIYEDFAKEHPDVYPEQIQARIRALREYIEDHVEKLNVGPSQRAPS